MKKNNKIESDNTLNNYSLLYLQFKHYFIITWLEFFENGTLDYSN